MSNLNYKASNIARAERELNANFFETLEGLGKSTPSFNALLLILRAGGLSEQEADDLLDTIGIEAALEQAVEGLGRAGFLAKMKLTAAQNQEIQKSAETISQEASRRTGDPTKA